MTLLVFSSLWEAMRGCGLCRGFWANEMGGEREREKQKLERRGRSSSPAFARQGKKMAYNAV